MKCKVCGMSMRRLERKGFLQNKIYPMFGYYPWECPGCRKPVMLKKQHWRKRRTAHQDGLE